MVRNLVLVAVVAAMVAGTVAHAVCELTCAGQSARALQPTVVHPSAVAGHQHHHGAATGPQVAAADLQGRSASMVGDAEECHHPEAPDTVLAAAPKFIALATLPRTAGAVAPANDRPSAPHLDPDARDPVPLALRTPLRV